MQTARLQPQQEIPPARSALAVGELDRQHLAATVPVNADRNQHRLADDDAGFAHPLVTGVEDQIRECFDQRTSGELRQARIQPLLDHLHSVVGILEAGQTNLKESIQRLFVWTRRNIETIGSGPWFDGEVVNFTNPFQVNAVPKQNGPARNFGVLFQVPRGVR